MNQENIIPTGRLLLDAFRYFEERLIRQLREEGIDDINASHLNVLRHLDPGGLRLTSLARDASLTKQATSAIVKELVEKNYLSYLPDPYDGRAKIVSYTQKGVRLIKKAIRIVNQLEQDLESTLGEAQYKVFRQLLITFTQQRDMANAAN